VRLSDPAQYQEIVDAEWNIIYAKLQACADAGAKIVLSRLAIGDLATQFFADRDIFCAGRVRARAAGPPPPAHRARLGAPPARPRPALRERLGALSAQAACGGADARRQFSERFLCRAGRPACPGAPPYRAASASARGACSREARRARVPSCSGPASRSTCWARPVQGRHTVLTAGCGAPQLW
jgi:hypothetical protein